MARFPFEWTDELEAELLETFHSAPPTDDRPSRHTGLYKVWERLRGMHNEVVSGFLAGLPEELHDDVDPETAVEQAIERMAKVWVSTMMIDFGETAVRKKMYKAMLDGAVAGLMREFPFHRVEPITRNAVEYRVKLDHPVAMRIPRIVRIKVLMENGNENAQ